MSTPRWSQGLLAPRRLSLQGPGALVEGTVRKFPSVVGKKESGVAEVVVADAANERDGGFSQSRYHLSEALEGADDRLLEQIEHAEALFWAHVRDALAERHP